MVLSEIADNVPSARTPKPSRYAHGWRRIRGTPPAKESPGLRSSARAFWFGALAGWRAASPVHIEPHGSMWTGICA